MHQAPTGRGGSRPRPRPELCGAGQPSARV